MIEKHDADSHNKSERSRVRGMSRSKAAEEPMARAEESPLQLFGESRLRGEAVERSRIIRHLDYLGSLTYLLERFDSYEKVLSGSTRYSEECVFKLDDGFLLKEGFSLFPRKSIRLMLGSHATTWDTGCNVNALVENAAQESQRYKFYLSLDLSTSERLNSARSFMREIMSECRSQQLSVQTKSADHVYDSCNIYTWHPRALASILQKRCAMYPSIWKDTEHFFQGALRGVNESHVGFAHEPLGTSPLRQSTGIDGSHSERMGKLGFHLDQEIAKGRSVDEALFREAAARAAVRPDRPWLLKV